MRVLILGGTGVFGGRLAQLLAIQRPEISLLIGSRDVARAEAAATALGTARGVALDRDDDLAEAFQRLRPDAVVDAAGPFQEYGERPYRVAEAAIAAGAHYLDLSDDAAFTAGIGALDAQARQAGVVVLSGVSSTPALSGAAAEALAAGLVDIALIETVISPGNRAPRGLSVVRAILSQAGRPRAAWRGGEWRDGVAWGDAERIALPGVGRRWVSPIGAPELELFPERFQARSVRFQAGLELGALHHGLRFAALPVRLGLIRSLAPLAQVFRSVAGWFEPLGSDRGGMRVRVCGRDADGAPLERRWSLAVGSGDGPFTPATPAFALLDRLDRIAPGARACLDVAPLAVFEAALSPLDAETRRETRPAPRLFEAALGPEAWPAAPRPVRRLHDSWDLERFRGEGAVLRGGSLPSRLIGFLFRFPPTQPSVPVEVEIERRGAREIWRRRFGDRRFSSTLSPGPAGHVYERFGPLKALLRIALVDGRLTLEITRAWFCGAPLPKPLTPKGDFWEAEDAEGRFRFHVDLSAPLIGRIVRYTGWLDPVARQSAPKTADGRENPC